ncbi:gamma carbonic anhydrase family protein [Halogeometricum limi]|uniref:Carbonic anhydrase or acetyltransferase, isoleucine patch superfamily n=1 Tax=Halogeometricum limi TaxID=555875 RepID=A0A1I6IB95_9EURY|nr:gamma carbonic anhydrase family protein [Halogeometricum limi]SFR63953.1 Carbonic anhydrase or acetyltransferase, isoleucine patch superfamily [Halogeometricum limi]
MIRRFEETSPAVAESAFVSEMAYLVGDVTVGPEASIWPFVCVRGDFGPSSIGEQTNVQDFTMLHEADVGPRVTVGHHVTIDGASVGADSLVGIGSTVLPGASVGSDCIVGAGAVVTPDQEIPDGHVAFGIPAETQPISDDHREYVRWNCEEYLDMTARYRAQGGFERFPDEFEG